MSAGSAPRDTMTRDLLLLLGVPGLVTVLLLLWWRPWRPWRSPYEASSAVDIFNVASGTWDWTGAHGFCAENPHTITFSADRQLMTITPRIPWTDSAGVEQGPAVYDIQEHTRERIRGQIRGETRLTKSGEPVVWDLVLFSADEYRWHRTDWPPGSYTEKVVRCPTDSTTASDAG
jgi:hypothetical protein